MVEYRVGNGEKHQMLTLESPEPVDAWFVFFGK